MDGRTVRLREPHDLSFLARWGRVFRVLDDQDSGNLCFGVSGAQGKLFVKYVGAETVRYSGDPVDAIKRARQAVRVYRALEHPTLVRLREAVELDHGFALIVDWTDAVPVGRQYGQSHRVRELSLPGRVGAVAHIFLGDDATKSRQAWVGGDELFEIAGRALEPDRNRRWPSVATLADAWRAASAGSHRHDVPG